MDASLHFSIPQSFNSPKDYALRATFLLAFFRENRILLVELSKYSKILFTTLLLHGNMNC